MSYKYFPASKALLCLVIISLSAFANPSFTQDNKDKEKASTLLPLSELINGKFKTKKDSITIAYDLTLKDNKCMDDFDNKNGSVTKRINIVITGGQSNSSFSDAKSTMSFIVGKKASYVAPVVDFSMFQLTADNLSDLDITFIGKASKKGESASARIHLGNTVEITTTSQGAKRKSSKSSRLDLKPGKHDYTIIIKKKRLTVVVDKKPVARIKLSSEFKSLQQINFLNGNNDLSISNVVVKGKIDKTRVLDKKKK